MKLSLRLLTVICYFLPFIFFQVTCNGFTPIVAYNKDDAGENMMFAAEEVATSKGATPTDSVFAQNVSKDSTDNIGNKSFLEAVAKKVIMPTDSSLSGIGAIPYYKNIAGKVVIALSLLISLIVLLLFKFLKSQRVKRYLLPANIICITVFIVDSIISDVTLLWGTGVLFVLLLMQVWIDRKQRKKVVANKGIETN